MKFSRWVNTVDTHTEGEPTRIITGGLAPIPGRNLAEKMLFFRENLDSVRTSLMTEPRGHKNMFGCLLTEPTLKEADYGVIFMDSGGYMTMCGHATIGVATALSELGMVNVEEPFTRIRLESASGLVETRVAFKGGKAQSVSFRNVPAYAEYLDADLDVPGLGMLKVDVGFGGNYFVFFSAEAVDLDIHPKNIEKVIDAGMRVLERANQALPVQHPQIKGINSIYVATIVGKPENPKAGYRNVHVFSNRQFDHSPGGTGTSARMAVLHAKGRLGLKEEIQSESITGGLFKGRLLEETQVGNKKAVIPEITGKAHITGLHQFVIDEEDHLKEGFLIQ